MIFDLLQLKTIYKNNEDTKDLTLIEISSSIKFLKKLLNEFYLKIGNFKMIPKQNFLTDEISYNWIKKNYYLSVSMLDDKILIYNFFNEKDAEKCEEGAINIDTDEFNKLINILTAYYL